MKRKLELFLIFLSLGVLLLPQQNLSAQIMAFNCCETQSLDPCHDPMQQKDSGVDSSSSTSDQNCDTHCAQYCGLCLHFGTPLLISSNSDTGLRSDRKFKSSVFSYLSPFVLKNSTDIWQPPKIG